MRFVFPFKITIKRAGWFYSWITGKTEGHSALGLQTITLTDDAFSKTDDYGSFVLLHEFGHFFNSVLKDRANQDFRDTFWKDRNCIPVAVSEIAKKNPTEDFSETFAAYIWMTQNNSDFSTVQGVKLFPFDERAHYMEWLFDQVKGAAMKQ